MSFILGNTSGGGGGASGKIGIADATGTYTYYNDINSAVTSATSGDVVEFFANIEETSAVSWTLKAGVNYNLNGYTYTLNEPTGTNVLDASFLNSGDEVHFWNGTIKRIGSSAVGGNNTNMVLETNTLASIYWHDCVLECSNGKVVKVSGNTTLIGGTYISRYVSNISTIGAIDSTSGTATIIDAKILSRGAYAYRGYGSVKFYDCYIYSESNIAVNNTNAGLELHNCTVHSDGNIALASWNGKYVNTHAYSTGGPGIDAGGEIIGCTGYSWSNNGIKLAYSSSECFGSVGHSKSSYGISLNNTSATLSGSFGKSDTSTACFGQGSKISGCTFEAGTGSNNHAVWVFTSGISIFGCTLIVRNTSANAIFSTSAINVKYGNNTIMGNPSVPINANVSQAQVSTPDSFGNIVAD